MTTQTPTRTLFEIETDLAHCADPAQYDQLIAEKQAATKAAHLTTAAAVLDKERQQQAERDQQTARLKASTKNAQALLAHFDKLDQEIYEAVVHLLELAKTRRAESLAYGETTREAHHLAEVLDVNAPQLAPRNDTTRHDLASDTTYATSWVRAVLDDQVNGQPTEWHKLR